jgi:hypothetical protein
MNKNVLIFPLYINEMESMPLFFENSALLGRTQIIIDYINNHQEDFGEIKKDDYWSGRSIFFHNIKDNTVKDILLQYKDELINKFHELSGIEDDVYYDTLHLARWPVGYELIPHADAVEPDGRDHPFPYRNFGTVGFLNENFEGGILYYPNKDNLQVTPKTGYSAIHTGGLDCLHGVTRITSGCRYTIASFLTYDKNRQMTMF